MCYRHASHEKWQAHHEYRRRRKAEKFRRWAKAYGHHQPPVNVRELDDRYELFLFAPERENEDFKLALRDRILTISAPAPAANEEQGNWKRREYQAREFERQFDLNEKIDVENISASYENGTLLVSLPKLEGQETFRQDIPVA